jgi:tRNA threonylcarbamoyladenosine biosynthesis protein TsaB
MLITGLDTSTTRLSLCLWDGRSAVVRRDREPDRRLAEVIMLEIRSLCQTAGKTAADLTGVAVGLGPGSFTSLRVGAATAQALAQALHIPVAGISSFQAIAAASPGNRVAVMADAHRGQYYAALYARQRSGWQAEVPEHLCDLAEATAWFKREDTWLSGPAAALVYDPLTRALGRDIALVPDSDRWPRAEVLAALAQASLAQGGTAPEAVTPLYLRRTQAEESKGGCHAGL